MSRRQSGALAFSVETLHKFAFISNRFGRASFQEIDELSKFSIFFHKFVYGIIPYMYKVYNDF